MTLACIARTITFPPLLFLSLLCMSIVGCVDVKPWQKGTLARDIMAFDPDPLEARFRRHVYQSKEGAGGGYGAGIGACGCN